MVKNIISKILNTFSVVIIILAIMLLLSVVMTKSGDVPKVAGCSFFRVLTGSMEPEIREGSFIVVKDAPASEIKKGDIISYYFYIDGVKGQVNTHRVTDVAMDGDHYVFSTKGDANSVEDKYKTYDTDYLGKVIFKSYLIGVVIRLVANPLVFFPFILLPLIIMLVLNIYTTVKSSREIANAVEQEEIQKILDELKEDE